jgi:hypothetical protein
LDGNAPSLSSTPTPTPTPAADTSSLVSSSDEDTLTETPQTEAPVPASSVSSPTDDVVGSVEPANTGSSSSSSASSSSDISSSETSSSEASSSTSGSASSSDHVGALTDVSGTISNAARVGLSTSGFVGIAFGALACVGAIVLIVTYKKKGGRDSEGQQRPPSSCAYLEGNGFTPDSRSLDAILDAEKPHSSSLQTPNEKLVPVLSMADLSSSSSARPSSPFGTNSRTVRVSSPVRQFSSNCSEDDMVFATSSSRQHDGSDVVLTFAEMDRTSSASTVAAIEAGRGQVLL